MVIDSMPFDRPRLRGHLHLVAAVVSLAGLVWLLVDGAHAPLARRRARAVYGLTAVALYTAHCRVST